MKIGFFIVYEIEITEHIDNILKLIPSKKEYTSSITMRVLYKSIQYFRSRFESMFTILETEYQHSKFFSDEVYK